MCIEQKTSFEPISVRIGPDLRPVGEISKLKKGEQITQKMALFSPVCGGATCEPIAAKLVFVGLTDVVTNTGGIMHVSLLKANGLYIS